MSDKVDKAADMARQKVEQEVKPAAMSSLRTWGESPLPPTLLATLIAAQHLRPPQILPLLFAPVLLGSTYMNLNGATTEAAGTSAAWSALYVVLANRRRQALRSRFGVRGVVRGATMLGCAAQAVAGGWVYATSRSTKWEDEEEGK